MVYRLLNFRLGESSAKAIALVAAGLSLATAIVLGHLATTLSGTGDQLEYYRQAGELLPFTDHFYGPSYFVALRLVHSLGLDWFASGKVIGFLSTCAFLVASYSLFGTVLDKRSRWLALGLLALNAQVVSSAGYSTLTVMYGSAWLVAAIAMLAKAPVERSWPWFACGIGFGLAALARFQAVGFVLGAILGVAFLPVSIPRRMKLCAALVAGTAIPVLGWNIFLTLAQGGPPQDWNFANLGTALGEFHSSCDGEPLVLKYGSLRGVLAANPMNFFRIVAFGFYQLARFPIDEGVSLLGWNAAWLLPGVLVAMTRRSNYAPWTGAFAMGLLLTGLTGTGWMHYYIPSLPLLIYLTAVGIESLGSEPTGRNLVGVGWSVALVGALAWGGFKSVRGFRDDNWPEWTTAREYLNTHVDSTTLVSSTATSLSYGGRFRFVDYDNLAKCRDTVDVVRLLRAAGVSRLVVTERHTLFNYPSQKRLLEDSVPDLPQGLIRDTLITTPKRLVIYRVVPDSGR